MTPVWWVLSAVSALPAPARDVRVAVVVGNNEGLDGEEPLAYAEEDARKIHRLLVDLGGLDPERAYLVTAQNSAAVWQALSAAAGRVEELARQGPTTFILYISAHADQEALHLNGERLPLAELRGRLSGLSAALRLVVIDACRTPVRVAKKGGFPGPEVAIDTSVNTTGEVFIASTGPGETAQEWTYLRGALFTHHLLTALRGAADFDGDAQVTLSEAYAYTYRNTTAQSVRAGGSAQKPSYEIELRGFGEWTFTWPARMGSSLVLGKDLEGTFWIADRGNRLLAEVSKAAGEMVKVAVQPGWYRVVRPGRGWAYATDVNLVWGGAQTLAAGDFVRVKSSQTRLRGSEPIVLRPWRLDVAYALSTGTVAGMAAMHGAMFGAERLVGDVVLRAGVGFSTAPFAAQGIAVRHRELLAQVGAGYELYAGVFSATVGVQAEAALAQQSLARDHADTIARVFGVREDHRRALVPAAGLFGELRLPMGDRAWAGLGAGAGARGVPLWEGGTTWRPYARGQIGAGYSF